jgi:uncharacterized protein with NAD-binding domain and iron-sulfur cluster
MITAVRLLERGYEPSLYDESRTRLGGKAGANKNGRDYNDHGYHIFPVWYVNTWQLVKELSIESNFVDFNDLHQMLPLKPDRVPRGCYEPQPRSPMARLSIKHTKATKCRPATVSGSLS